jgi:phosphate transport system substrate-binding protein
MFKGVEMKCSGLFFALVLLVSGLAHAAEELKVAAGVSAVSNIFDRVTKPFEAKSGIKVVYTNPDPKGQGGDVTFTDVDQGVAEAGASGAVWDDWLKMMKDKNYKARNLDKMKSRVIGRDRIQFMTYKGGPKKIEEAQLRGVLTGKITNWKQAGGEDRPITLIISEEQPSTGKFIEERFLGGQKLAKANAKIISKSEGIANMVKAIAETPGSIGFGPVNLVNDTVNVPEHVLVGRPITMIWIGEPSPRLQKFMDFIVKEGPKYGVVQ